jgi:hypothetical protein
MEYRKTDHLSQGGFSGTSIPPKTVFKAQDEIVIYANNGG